MGRSEPAAGPRILVIAGPTGTGKSSLALRVAEELGGEIVGCDALQVYRRFDIGTAKPSRTDREAVPHHLVDFVDPGTDYTLADYVRDADAAVADILRRRKVPVVAGGTGMYLRGLLKGVVPAPARHPELRSRLAAMAGRHGAARMHRWLRSLDPESSERLPQADSQRIVRALEIVLLDDRSWSRALASEGTWSRREERYSAVKFGLEMDRQALAARLETRVDAFLDSGLVEEVRSLLAGGVPPSANAFKAIGYREILRALQDGLSLDTVPAEIKKNTRRYAKRQRTWFRKEANMEWLDAALPGDVLAERVVQSWIQSGGLLGPRQTVR